MRNPDSRVAALRFYHKDILAQILRESRPTGQKMVLMLRMRKWNPRKHMVN